MNKLLKLLEEPLTIHLVTAKLTAKLADFYSQRRTPANKRTRKEACQAARNSPYKKRHEYGISSYYILLCMQEPPRSQPVY